MNWILYKPSITSLGGWEGTFGCFGHAPLSQYLTRRQLCGTVPGLKLQTTRGALRQPSGHQTLGDCQISDSKQVQKRVTELYTSTNEPRDTFVVNWSVKLVTDRKAWHYEIPAVLLSPGWKLPTNNVTMRQHKGRSSAWRPNNNSLGS